MRRFPNRFQAAALLLTGLAAAAGLAQEEDGRRDRKESIWTQAKETYDEVGGSVTEGVIDASGGGEGGDRNLALAPLGVELPAEDFGASTRWVRFVNVASHPGLDVTLGGREIGTLPPDSQTLFVPFPLEDDLLEVSHKGLSFLSQELDLATKGATVLLTGHWDQATSFSSLFLHKFEDGQKPPRGRSAVVQIINAGVDESERLVSFDGKTVFPPRRYEAIFTPLLYGGKVTIGLVRAATKDPLSEVELTLEQGATHSVIFFEGPRDPLTGTRLPVARVLDDTLTLD